MIRFQLYFLASAALGVCAFASQNKLDECSGRRVFVQELPTKFNVDLMFHQEDEKLQDWFAHHMVHHLELLSENNGFGPVLPGLSNDSDLQGLWYRTDQYAMEVIFHSRMKSFRCRVADFTNADMVYIPYYGAHDALRHVHKDIEMRDSLAFQLLGWLQQHPAWQRRQGSDHFWVLGNDVWDFHRLGPDGWGSQLLTMPSSRDRIWTVCAETNPGMQTIMSAPRPIAFHPQSQTQLERWQRFVLAQERQSLFAITGGRRRRESEAGAARDSLFWQCENSKKCNFLDCTDSHRSQRYPCESPQKSMSLYLSATFCLHPVGDSCSRRSVLDGILAGCIPVVFRSCSLQEQQWWHLHSGGPFFVTIPASSVRAPWDGPDSVDKVLVEDILASIPEVEVLEMRHRLVSIIPRMVYGGKPDGDRLLSPEFKDAIDIMIDGLAFSMKINSAWHKTAVTTL